MHATPVTRPPSPAADRTRYVLAAIAALVGLVWIGQGAGLIAGSFMTGDSFWAATGLALVAVSGLYAAWPRLRRR
jgi:hypothetical protein